MEDPVDPSCRSRLSPEDGISITCPSCGVGNMVNFQGTTPQDRKFLVRCKCGAEFETLSGSRRHGREMGQITGEYTNQTSGTSGTMSIEDLSMEGMGFRDTLAGHFNLGDLVVVAFELDDFEKSRIKAKVEVRQICAQSVGCEILEIMEGGANYGLYLLP